MSRIGVLATVLAIAVAVLLVLPTAHAVYSKTFTTTVKVVTSKETFSATGSVDVYFIAYPRAIITVYVTNPGTTSATATISWDCLGGGSASISVPAGGTASYDIVLNVPSPPTSYIACHVTVTPANMTGIQLTVYYEANVVLTYNDTYMTYTVPLFTEPYYALGGVNKYFRYFLVYPVYGTPPSGYTILANLNTTLSTSYSDSAVVENGKSISPSGIMLNITDTAAATGRYLGTVNISLTVPRSVNLVITPSLDKFVSAADIVAPNITKVYVARGESYMIALVNKSIVFDSSGSAYYYNFTVARIDVAPSLAQNVEKAEMLDGYGIYVIGYGKLASGKIEVLALVRPVLASNLFYEPVRMVVNVEAVPIMINITLPDVVLHRELTWMAVPALVQKIVNNSLIANVTVTDLKTADLLYGGATGNEGFIVRSAIGHVTLADYALAVYYVAVVNSSGVVKYFLNVTDVGEVPAFTNIVTGVRDGYPIINATVVASGGEYGHISIYVPYSIKLSATEVAPIRTVVTLSYSKPLDLFRIFVIPDKLPSGIARTVHVPSDITVKEPLAGVYMLEIPFTTYNGTPFTIDVLAVLTITVKWADGSPASGITVTLYRNNVAIYTTLTDSEGRATLVETYGVYRVEASTVVHGVEISTSKDITLTDDSAITLTFGIPKPKPEVASVVLNGPAVAYVNTTVNMVVSARLNMMSEEELKFSGELVCAGPTSISKTFTITFRKGDVETSIVVPIRFTKAGVYTCKAYVDNVGSNSIVVEVRKQTLATAMIEALPYLQVLAFLAVLFIAAVIAYVLLRRRGPTISVRLA